VKHSRAINIPKNPKEIWLEAISMGSGLSIDEKGTEDNPGIWMREPSKLDFEEAFSIIQRSKPHWVMIFRNESYLTNDPNSDYWDFGGCNLGNNDYGEVFIFIKVSTENAKILFQKHGIEIEEF